MTQLAQGSPKPLCTFSIRRDLCDANVQSQYVFEQWFLTGVVGSVFVAFDPPLAETYSLFSLFLGVDGGYDKKKS